MDFQCYKCKNQFENLKLISNHLKNDHELKNGSEKLNCVVKKSRCGKSFLNFDSLRSHIKICLEKTKTLCAQSYEVTFFLFELTFI